MMPDRIITRGHPVTLYVRFRDLAGNPINADTTPRVEISDPNGTIVRPLSTSGVTQDSESVGLYKFNYSPSLTLGVDGYHQDRWVAVIGGETVQASFQFLVIDGGSITQDVDYVPTPGDDHIFEFTQAETDGINILLKLLKKRLKNDGTRKVPDGNGGFIDEPCSIFSNEELICFLVNSLSEFNQWPHFTQFTFADPQIYGIFADIIIQGANLLALAAQTLIEKGREFSISDNGVTYQPPQVADMLNNQYGTQLGYYKEKLKAIKTSLKPSPKSLGTFRTTAISPAFIRLRHLRSRQIV
jgi:hypothetical protein